MISVYSLCLLYSLEIVRVTIEQLTKAKAWMLGFFHFPPQWPIPIYLFPTGNRLLSLGMMIFLCRMYEVHSNKIAAHSALIISLLVFASFSSLSPSKIPGILPSTCFWCSVGVVWPRAQVFNAGPGGCQLSCGCGFGW